MAIVTPNLGLTVPAMGDAPNMGVVSQALEDIDTYAGKVEDRTADAYDDSASYAVNDLCIHDNKLYKCSTAITGGESWNSSHWTETSLAYEIGSLNDQIATLIFNSTYEATTSSTGAVSLKTIDKPHRYLNALLTTGSPGFVFRRDDNYFTVLNNSMQPLANTSVKFTAYFAQDATS